MENINKNGFFVIKKPKIGNFKCGVNSGNKQYTQVWNETKDNYLENVYDDSGNYVLFVSKNDFETKKIKEIRAKLLYDTQISFEYTVFNEETSLSVSILNSKKEKKNINLSKENKFSEKIEKDTEIIIKIQSNKSYSGEIICIISNMEVILDDYEEVKVNFDDFLSNFVKNNS